MKFEYPVSGTSALAPYMIKAAQESNGFVLELGCHKGFGSTLAFREGLSEHPAPLMISVDWEDYLDEYRPTEPWWHLVLGDTRQRDTLLKVDDISLRAPGVIYIDTDHNYEQLRQELALWGALADRETVWLFHDVKMFGFWNDDMVRAILEYAAEYGWTYDVVTEESHGLGRMRR